MKFGTEVNYKKKLFTKPEFRETRFSKSHTLLRGVNKLRPALPIFLDRFGSNSEQDISTFCRSTIVSSPKIGAVKNHTTLNSVTKFCHIFRFY
jgi:hypothetical protein